MFLKSMNMICLAKRQRKVWQVARIKQEQALYLQTLARSFAGNTRNIVYDKDNDYYQVLGVSQSDDASKIKKAYFKLAQQYHPDKHAGQGKEAEEKFKAISSAYDVLKHDETRKVYDVKKAEVLNSTKRNAS